MLIEDGGMEPSTADMIADVTSSSGDDGAAIDDSGAGDLSPDPLASKPETEPQKFTYKTDAGKEVTETIEQILERAGLGYHYAQKAADLNQREEQLKQQFGEHDPQRLMKFSQFDEYARQNPEWWNHVNESWQNRSAQQPVDQVLQSLDPDNELSPVVKGLHEKLEGLTKQLSTVLESNQKAQEFIQNEQRSRIDSALDQEIQTVGKEYGVDFTESDTQGQTMEDKVIAHAEQLGLNGNKPGHFTAAFKDLFFNDLVQKQLDSRLKTHAKETQRQRKNGIISTNETPKFQSENPFNGQIRGTNYDEIGEFIKGNLGNLDQLIS